MYLLIIFRSMACQDNHSGAVPATCLFGPYLSWMFRARLTDAPAGVAETIIGDDVTVGEIFERYTNTIDLGLTTGIDFGIPFGPGNMVFDFRYNLGAINVFNTVPTASVRNYVFLLMAGYSIEISSGILTFFESVKQIL
jgi:hypothetical protein